MQFLTTKVSTYQLVMHCNCDNNCTATTHMLALQAQLQLEYKPSKMSAIINSAT